MTWLAGLIRRRWVRLVGAVVGVALAVAFFASLGAFFAASKAKMTQQALVGVPVDWQVQLSPGVDPAKAQQVIAAQPGVTVTQPLFYGDATGFRATVQGTTQTTGPGKVLGLPPAYATTFPGELRYLVGGREGVLLAQQTAANLHAAIGTTVRIGLPGGTQDRKSVV